MAICSFMIRCLKWPVRSCICFPACGVGWCCIDLAEVVGVAAGRLGKSWSVVLRAGCGVDHGAWTEVNVLGG